MARSEKVNVSENLRKKISESTEENKQDLENFCSSPDVSLDLLRLILLSKLDTENSNIVSQLIDPVNSNEFGKIFSDVKVLEIFLSSGDVESGNWNKALELLAELIQTDSEVTKHPLKLKLAVAVALTFAMPVISYAYRETTKEIDPIQRYLSYSRWCFKEPSPMFDIVEYVSCWHLRYVVGSWAEDIELEWARDNVDPEFLITNKIGYAAQYMISYRDFNEDGVSIHDGAAFYNHRPETLELLFQEGGVSDVASKFGMALCQAFGVPAMPLCLPGDPCILTWYTGNEWVRETEMIEWEDLFIHEGIQSQWSRSAPFLRLMSAAQESGTFAISEKMRIAASTMSPETRIGLLFSCVIPKCPENYSSWLDFLQLAKDTGLIGYSENVAEGKPVTVSSTEQRAQNVTENSGSEWWTGEETAWIEIDLEENFFVDRVQIQWWGYSKADEYRVFAIAENGQKLLVKTERDQIEDKAEKENYCNQWITLSGWKEETRKVRLELYDGNEDPWNMNMLFGLRQIQVFSADRIETRTHSVDICKEFEKEAEIQENQSAETRIISDNKLVKASSAADWAFHITENSWSQWWTEEETAWIEIDLQETCYVDQVKIQWWQHSKADRYKMFAIAENGQQFLVKTEEDQTLDEEEKEKDCNQWIKLSCWKEETRKVRLELYDGNETPSYMNSQFGLRQVVISGRAKINTVNLCGSNWRDLVVQTNSNSTWVDQSVSHHEKLVWKGNDQESWLELDFGRICCVKSIVIDWEEMGKTEKVEVLIKNSSGNVKIEDPTFLDQILQSKLFGNNDIDVDNLSSLNKICRGIRLNFFGKDVALKSVKIYGVKYTNKSMIINRMKRYLEDHPFVFDMLVDQFLKY